MEYRVKPLEGVRFRKWATAKIKEYIFKDILMDDERLKNLGGGKYFYELLNKHISHLLSAIVYLFLFLVN